MLRIKDFRDVFGYTYGQIQIHTVELEAHENGSVSVLNYCDEFNGRQLRKIPENTPLVVQLHLKQDGYYELYDDALMIIDGGKLKNYKRELDHQTKDAVQSVQSKDEVLSKIRSTLETLLNNNYDEYDREQVLTFFKIHMKLFLKTIEEANLG